MINFFIKLKRKICDAGLWFKKQAKKLLVILGIISVVYAADNLTINEISLEKVSTKYDQSVEIKNLYQRDGVKLERKITKNAELDKYKNEPKDEIKIEIGDNTPVEVKGLLGGATGATTSEFTPSIKLTRWNEVFFKITPIGLDKVATKDKTLSFEGNKIKYGTPKMSFEMYEATDTPEGGYKFIWYLNEKPATNKVEFAIESSGLDFFYQPPLTQEYQNGYSEEFQKEIVVSETQVKDLEGNVLVERPENVVGSYAVYHQTKGGMNDINGKEYKTGQAFFIYRPHIIDATGAETWGNLHIENGIYSVEIPQDFLDKAVYPIKSNDTFGYTTAGGSSQTHGQGYWKGRIGTSGAAGTLDSIHESVDYTSTATYHLKAVITNSAFGILTNGVGETVTVNNSGQGWKYATYSTKPTIAAATVYYAGMIAENADTNHWFNSGGTWGDSRQDTTNSYTTPTNPTDAGGSSSLYSIYATYTPAGGGAAAPTPQIIIIEGVEDNLLREIMENIT